MKNNDEFGLSIGQAQQLEFAFQRAGYTTRDVQDLCNDSILSQVKIWLREGRPLPGKTYLKNHRMDSMETVFNEDIWCRRLGFPEAMRTRLLNVLRGADIRNLYQLIDSSEGYILRRPNMGKTLYAMLRTVLAESYLCVGMDLPSLSNSEYDEVYYRNQ